VSPVVIVCLGTAQLISWGITYYLVGALGSFIVDDMGWDKTTVFGGFSIGLVAMGLCSSAAGRFVDRHGRASLILGSVIIAAGCLALAAVHSPIAYVIAWIPIGVGMRFALYDAAFATLARLGGAGAARAIAQITLIGGFASTVFWPVGYYLAHSFGWRAAIAVYAVMALATIPLVLAVPRPGAPEPSAAPHEAEQSAPERDVRAGAILYAVMVTLQTFLLAGMTSHVLVVLGDIGVSTAVAVSAAALQGVGQFIARFVQIFLRAVSSPLRLAILAAGFLAFAFVFAVGGHGHAASAYAFMLLFGAGNGLMTIAKGTLPLIMFRREVYGAKVGRLIAPGFFLTATAPTVYAALNARYPDSALVVSATLAAATFAVTLVLYGKLRGRDRPD
jgi:MFS family permease